MRNHSLTVLAGIGAAAVAAPALAGEASTGTLILDARARLEHFDTTSADATAGSVRVRLGWKQPLAKGLTGLVELEAVGAGPLLTTVVNECARIHEAIYETFVAYPLETRLPA